jgi:hypothetical protein
MEKDYLKQGLAWLVLFLAFAISLPAILGILTLLNSALHSGLLEVIIAVYYIIAPLVMLGIAAVGLFPIGDYSLVGSAGTNPVAARTVMSHFKWRHEESGNFFLLIAFVGLISLFGYNPLQMFYSSLEPKIDTAALAPFFVATFTLLSILYIKRLHRYIKSEDEE